MTIEQLAITVIKACEKNSVDHMLTGAFAFNYYGVPRATKDVDIVVDVSGSRSIKDLIMNLEPEIQFNGQVQFDTLTWGRRHIGTPAADTTLQIELFELFDDDFVQSQFRRKKRLILPQLEIPSWIPTPEDIVVQKLRWGRPKDLDDARDVLAIEGPENLDMSYIENWCTIHQTTSRLSDTLARIPPL
jgi:hypothetical protein